MTHSPLVTVVMPAHNAERWIGAAIQSVLDQTVKEFELWVLENGSQDATVEVARSFSDRRVRVTELGPVGFTGALAFGLEHAQTPWVARMDADDICTPDRLELQLRAARRKPDACMVGTSSAVLTHSGHCIAGRKAVREQRLSFDSVALGRGRVVSEGVRYCPDPSMMFKRERALEVGGYDPDFKLADTTLWLRMLRGSSGLEIPEVTYLHRALPFSLNSSHSQGVSVRRKYAPEAAAEFERRYPAAPLTGAMLLAGYWWQMFLYDSIARDHAAAVRSLREYARHSGRLWGRVAACVPLVRVLCWAARLRSGAHYQHRADLDHIVRGVSGEGAV